ncbi:MAG: DUF4271 domain-containing protein [Flavobacteriales bacterium]|nr:DUF4271 domain-containing protein [Flavobacteriales bacterium]
MFKSAKIKKEPSFQYIYPKANSLIHILILLERTITEQFWLLIPVAAAILIFSKIKRNNPVILKATILSHFSKSQFKQIENNKSDQNFILLYWISIFFHGAYLHTAFFIEKESSFLIYILVAGLILFKNIVLTFSGWLFEQKELFKRYVNSHQTTVIIQGLIILPIAILNIIYQDTLFMVNKAAISLILLFLIYKISTYVLEARAQKISFFHLFSYICTLEILPWAAIIAFIL